MGGTGGNTTVRNESLEIPPIRAFMLRSCNLTFALA